MTTLVQVSQQEAHAVTVNNNFTSANIAATFGIKPSLCVGLTFAYYGGVIDVDGVRTTIADGTLTLTGSATNYIQRTRAGVVSSNTSGFTAGQYPMYTGVATASVVTYTEQRLQAEQFTGRLVKAMGNVNQTLTAAEARANIIELTGALTAVRDVIVPTAVQQWTIFANVTTGSPTGGVRVITAAGTGITIAEGKRAIVYCDGTNVVRVTADA